MTFSFNNHLVPLQPGHAVSRSWTSTTGHRPLGVTWHWTAIESLARTRSILGGNNTIASQVSAHYGIGRTFVEGVDRYVSLENRSWHAGIGQKLRWDGRQSNNNTKGARACIGIETCNVGYARPGHPAQPDWITAVDTNSSWVMRVQPWTEDQMAMMIAVGKEIIERWPHIPPEAHHGHNDICPGYKQDVAGFPFAKILREIYEDPSIRDIWSPLWTTVARQRVLIALGFDLGPTKDDGLWGTFSQRALDRFQQSVDAVRIPYWTTFTCRDADRELLSRGLDLFEVCSSPA